MAVVIIAPRQQQPSLAVPTTVPALLHDLVRYTAERHGALPALVHGATQLTYSELASAIARTAAGLRRLGLRPDERVAVYLPKIPEAVIALFAAPLAGGVMVPINPVLKGAQVAHILRDCNVRLLVTSAERAAALRAVLRDCRDLRAVVIAGEDWPDEPLSGVVTHAWHTLDEVEPLKPPRRIDSDMAGIFYTSGSTGAPKGVVLSHRNLVSGAHSVNAYLHNGPEDRLLAVLPLSFDYGFSQLTTAFAAGASVVLLEYLLPRDVIRAVVRHRITGLAAVPPLWGRLVRETWPPEAAASLRYLTSSGGVMPVPVIQALRQALPDTQIHLMYGLTEAFRSTALPPEEIDRRPGSIGLPIPNAEIMVVREDGSECEPEEIGELVHRGSLVALGYWNDPERTAERFRPAPRRPHGLPLPEIAVWSGDRAWRDAEGYLYFAGREDHMIKTSGYRVSPDEIEGPVLASGLVTEAAAFGVPDAELGQAIVLAVAGEDASEAVLALCREQLPNYMQPRRVWCLDELPRTPNGKIDRQALRTRYAEHIEER
jgi:acyl-CoA ligase (AMP-forming) (exosortase A-associated)